MPIQKQKKLKNHEIFVPYLNIFILYSFEMNAKQLLHLHQTIQFFKWTSGLYCSDAIAIILVQLLLCFICYKNTQKRIHQEAQALRTEIGAEHEAIKISHLANINMSQMAQFNYYLVYPNDPRFQANYNQIL